MIKLSVRKVQGENYQFNKKFLQGMPLFANTSFIIAKTRTQETLTMTYSSKYLNRPKGPSRFLKEMGLLKESPIVKERYTP
jgi:hypothetical protein